MAASHRLEKVSSELVREISRIILHELNDPRLKFVTVTRVKVSPDLRHAIVFVSTLGDEKARNRNLHGLRHAPGFVHRTLRDRIKSLKFIPEIRFLFDPSIEGAVRIGKLIDDAVKGATGKRIEDLPAGDVNDGEEE